MILLRLVVPHLQWYSQLKESHVWIFNKSSYLMAYQKVQVFFHVYGLFLLNESSQLSSQH